jgi:pimeloyl-ACP methyl ester carboxylesterase
MIRTGDGLSRYRLYSVRSGAPPGALPLVIVPGLAAAMAAWDPFIAAARVRGPVRVFDPNQWDGAGVEDEAGEPALADLTAGLIGLMDTMGMPQAHVLGHSLGGMVALDLVLRHPARVGALILMSTTPEAMPDEQRARALHLLDRLETGGTVRGAWFGHVPLSEPGRWPVPMRSEATSATPDPATAGSRAAAHAMVTRPDRTPHLGGITAPTLVLAGEMDGARIQRGAELLHGWIPTSRLVRIEGAGHHPHVDRPQAVEQLVLSFISEVEEAGG